MSITISATDPRIQYTASSSQTTFAVPFEFFAASTAKFKSLAINLAENPGKKLLSAGL